MVNAFEAKKRILVTYSSMYVYPPCIKSHEISFTLSDGGVDQRNFQRLLSGLEGGGVST